MKLCSACLLGIKCRYDAKSKANEKVIELAKKETLIPFCSEQLGGLPTPRIAQEIQNGTGEDVLDGKCKVLNKKGEDVTDQFIRGAEETLRLVKTLNTKEAIVKQKSPSCGFGEIFDGSFSGKIIKGNGVTSALLKRNGIKIITEQDI